MTIPGKEWFKKICAKLSHHYYLCKLKFKKIRWNTIHQMRWFRGVDDNHRNNCLEQNVGIEPTHPAWKAGTLTVVLILHYFGGNTRSRTWNLLISKLYWSWTNDFRLTRTSLPTWCLTTQPICWSSLLYYTVRCSNQLSYVPISLSGYSDSNGGPLHRALWESRTHINHSIIHDDELIGHFIFCNLSFVDSNQMQHSNQLNYTPICI